MVKLLLSIDRREGPQAAMDTVMHSTHVGYLSLQFIDLHEYVGHGTLLEGA